MTTLFFKFIASSALLIGIYWLMLRNKASYKANRIFLLSIPAISILMSTLSFEVYTSDTRIAVEDMLPKITIEQPTQISNSRTEEVLTAEAMPAASDDSAYTAASETTNADTDWAKYTTIAVISVSAILVLMALYYVIKIIRIRSRMKSEPTAEGYRMVKSMDIKTPFSFQKTIFMPADLDEDSERLIASHEKAHIAHRHYVDVLVSEFVTRILWFNPFIWIARNELRNVHEFEADHEVIIKGANIKNYQTTLLEMVLNESTPVVSGFNHSFIRRRFMEMRKSTAGTLGKIGKALSALSIAAMFCGFTFTSCKGDASGNNGDGESCQPGWFVIKGNVDQQIADSAYNVYLGDKYQHLSKEPDTSVVVRDKKWEYKVYLESPRAAKVAAIFPGGEVCEATIAFTAIPGDTLCLNVHNGFYDTEGTSRKYYADANDAILAMRGSTGGKTPYLPEINCQKMWKKVGYRKGNYSVYDAISLKPSEVYFTDSATILKLTTNDGTGNIRFGNRYDLVDKNGNVYKFMHTVLTDPTGNWDKEARVYGDYIYFEPLPMDTEEFGVAINGRDELTLFWENLHDISGEPDPEPNVTLNIKVDADADVTRIDFSDRTDTYFVDKNIQKNTPKAYQIYVNAGREYGYLNIRGKNSESMEYITLMEGRDLEITIHKDDVELNGQGYYAEWNEAYTYYHNLLKKEDPEKAKEMYSEFLIKKFNEEQFGGYFEYSFNNLRIFSNDEVRELIEKSRVVRITESPAEAQ